MQMVSRGKKAIEGRKRSRPDASARGGTERQKGRVTGGRLRRRMSTVQQYTDGMGLTWPFNGLILSLVWDWL